MHYPYDFRACLLPENLLMIGSRMFGLSSIMEQTGLGHFRPGCCVGWDRYRERTREAKRVEVGRLILSVYAPSHRHVYIYLSWQALFRYRYTHMLWIVFLKGIFGGLTLAIRSLNCQSRYKLHIYIYIYSHVSHLKGQCTNTTNWLCLNDIEQTTPPVPF